MEVFPKELIRPKSCEALILNKCKNAKTISYILSDHYGTKLEINCKKNYRNYKHVEIEQSVVIKEIKEES